MKYFKRNFGELVNFPKQEADSHTGSDCQIFGEWIGFWDLNFSWDRIGLKKYPSNSLDCCTTKTGTTVNLLNFNTVN